MSLACNKCTIRSVENGASGENLEVLHSRLIEAKNKPKMLYRSENQPSSDMWSTTSIEVNHGIAVYR